MFKSFKSVLSDSLKLIFEIIPKRSFLVSVLAAATLFSAAYLGNSALTVNIFDGEDFYIARTFSGNIKGAVGTVKLKSSSYKILSTKKKGKVANVELTYTFPVFVTVGGKTVKTVTPAATVRDILLSLGYDVDESDMIEPSADTVITETTYIDYTDIEYITGSYEQEIPFETKAIIDSSYAGTKLIKAGVNGKEHIEYTERIINGVSEGKVITAKTVIIAPVNAEQLIGTANTKPFEAVTTSASVKCISTLSPSAPIPLDASGVPVNYKKHITANATAYTYTGHNCSTGVSPQPGYIAVNPNYIPYGTKMYIVSSDGRFTYGYAIAADTGGFARKNPTKVDLFMGSVSDCKSFGNRNVEIYIIE